MSDPDTARHWKEDSDAHDARRRAAQAAYSKASEVSPATGARGRSGAEAAERAEAMEAAESTHRRAVNAQIVGCLTKLRDIIENADPLTEAQAQAVIRGIVSGLIPRISISY